VTLAAALLPRGLDPQPDPARSLLRRELAKAQYSHDGTLIDRIVEWLQRHLTQLNHRANDGSALLSPVTTAVLAIVVIGLLAYVLPRIRRERRAAAGGGAVLDDPFTAARDYRLRARAAMRAGRHGVAVVETFRAVAREMTDRTVLSGQAGQTAHEIGVLLAAAFPSYAERLGTAADLFDAVRYGTASATREQAEALIGLDAELAKARPVLPEIGLTPASAAGGRSGAGSSSDPAAALERVHQ
jgi:hypothetical protein